MNGNLSNARPAMTIWHRRIAVYGAVLGLFALKLLWNTVSVLKAL